MATLDYIVSYYFWSTIIVSLQIMLHFVLLNTLYAPESLANQLSVSAFQRAWAKCAFMTTVVSHHWSVFWSCSERQSMNLLFHQHLSTVWWIILLATAGLLHRFILHCRYDHPYLKPGQWSGYFYLTFQDWTKLYSWCIDISTSLRTLWDMSWDMTCICRILVLAAKSASK